MNMLSKKDFKKITDYIWEIPKSHRADMRVPARFYISEKMIEKILEDKTVEQAVNVAALPGIVDYSLVMPDAHEGYGQCIGGVFATRLSDGVISPGAVGYDINCLTKDTKILCGLGYYRKIIDFQNQWKNEKLQIADLNSSKEIINTYISRFLKIKPKSNCIFKIVTRSGNEIFATKDHPFYTPTDMKRLEELSVGEQLSVYPFKGVPYQKPSRKIIISEEDIKKSLLKLGRRPGEVRFDQNIRVLKKRNLLPLTYDHSKLPYLLKIMGFMFGDGSMNFIGKKRDGILHFVGKKEDLETIRLDLQKIGYPTSRVYSREKRKVYKGKVKYYKNYFFYVNASSLLILLFTLGIPKGKKVFQKYRVPRWIFKAPLWQKRLFIGAFFGAEFRIPHKRNTRKSMFNCPVSQMSKAEELISNGKLFLKDISKLVKEFGVKTIYINQRKKHISVEGKISWGLDLVFSSKIKSLINLWSKIGFEYNKKRHFIACAASQYLQYKEKILEEKNHAIKITIPRLLNLGLSYKKISAQLAGNPLTRRFIEDICWKLKKGIKNIIPHVPNNFVSFGDYLKKATSGLGNSGLVWDEIVEIKKIPYKEWVYDFTVDNKNHNFIANNFIVSNCGVRLLKSNLEKEEIKPYLKNLADQIYRDVPSGLGKGRKEKLSNGEIEEVLNKGAKWAVAKGFGKKEDLEALEENGCHNAAEARFVSSLARKRGQDQVGTLGSGNHFMEIQFVDEIFDKKTAEAFGLFNNQIVVLIHTGSRGLGHQVATDYIRAMMPVMQKYKIVVPDRELACTPFNSDEGQRYFSAMAASANFAWANRQMITFWVRQSFERILAGKLNYDLEIVYDVAHNIVKIEEYNGKKLIVHRKGATRAFGPGRLEIPKKYREVGQPVLIPGSMGTASYVLTGTKQAEDETFGSTCHGSGRVMSRKKAKRTFWGSTLRAQLERQGILVRCESDAGLAEEAPLAYKSVEEVVEVVHQAGISKKVARLKPKVVIKGE